MAPPTRVAILFALQQELDPFARRLSRRPDRDVWRSPPLPAFPVDRLGRIELLWTASGMGPHRAAAGADSVMSAASPDLLVIAGVAGALDPSLHVGDVVVADRVLNPPAPPIPAGTHFLQPTGSPSDLAETGAARVGALLSLDRVLVTAEEKRDAYRTAEQPLAVEMETAAAARVANRRGVPWAAVRAISDTANESLPLDFNALRTADGGLPTSRVARAAVLKPCSIPGLIRLGRNTSYAAERLADSLMEWLNRLQDCK